MHLGNRCAGHRRVVERLEDLAYRPVECTFDRSHGYFRRKRRYAVLQSGQFVRDVRRQQVAPRRHHLTELDKYRSEALQCLPQSLTAWRIELAPGREDASQNAQPWFLEAGEDQLIETVAKRNPDNIDAPVKARHSVPGNGGSALALRLAVLPGRFPTNWRNALIARRAAPPMAWAGTSPTMRARSSSTSQRT